MKEKLAASLKKKEEAISYADRTARNLSEAEKNVQEAYDSVQSAERELRRLMELKSRLEESSITTFKAREEELKKLLALTEERVLALESAKIISESRINDEKEARINAETRLESAVSELKAMADAKLQAERLESLSQEALRMAENDKKIALERLQEVLLAMSESEQKNKEAIFRLEERERLEKARLTELEESKNKVIEDLKATIQSKGEEIDYLSYLSKKHADAVKLLEEEKARQQSLYTRQDSDLLSMESQLKNERELRQATEERMAKMERELQLTREIAMDKERELVRLKNLNEDGARLLVVEKESVAKVEEELRLVIGEREREKEGRERAEAAVKAELALRTQVEEREAEVRSRLEKAEGEYTLALDRQRAAHQVEVERLDQARIEAERQREIAVEEREAAEGRAKQYEDSLFSKLVFGGSGALEGTSSSSSLSSRVPKSRTSGIPPFSLQVDDRNRNLLLCLCLSSAYLCLYPRVHFLPSRGHYLLWSLLLTQPLSDCFSFLSFRD